MSCVLVPLLHARNSNLGASIAHCPNSTASLRLILARFALRFHSWRHCVHGGLPFPPDERENKFLAKSRPPSFALRVIDASS